MYELLFRLDVSILSYFLKGFYRFRRLHHDNFEKMFPVIFERGRSKVRRRARWYIPWRSDKVRFLDSCIKCDVFVKPGLLPCEAYKHLYERGRSQYSERRMLTESFLYAKYQMAVTDAPSRTTLQIPFNAVVKARLVKQHLFVTCIFEKETL